jgi:tetratricopeptide (TPR) repeat protein
MNLPAIDRYPGPRSFYDNANDRLLFHGREEEIDLLFHRVCATRLLVLFGKSGVGKTSLLQAGIFEKLRQERHRFPILVRLNLPATPLETIQAAVSETCEKFGVDYTPGEGETLWEFFKTVMLWQGDMLLTPVLVLDQFEEIFTLRSTEERLALARELGDLFRVALPRRIRQKRQSRNAADNGDIAPAAALSEQPPDVHVIVSVREDFVGALQELAAEIPGIYDDRVRLSPLSDMQAEQAIRHPAAYQSTGTAQFTTPSYSYADDALTAIIRYLRGKSGVIEPFQLQLVCRDIEQQVAQRSAEGHPVICITKEVLGGEKRLNAIVKNFYQQTLDKLPQRDRWNVRRLCEEGLLNAEGFRLPLQENEIFRQYHLDNQALAPLIEARLLRKESRLESNFYELSHDSLTRPILENKSWKLTRKYRNIAYLTIFFMVLFTLATSSYLQSQEKKQAQKMRKEAEAVLDFLVFDLRDKLAPLGRLDIAEAIQQRVNDYYKKMGIDGQSMEVRYRYAYSYANMGDRLFAQGKSGDALENYQESLTILQELVIHDPSNTGWQSSVSILLVKIGDVLKEQGKSVEALITYQEGLKISQKLVAHDSNNTGWQYDVSISLVRIADVLNAQGKLADALENYQESLEILQKLIARDPSNTGWQRDFSVALERIGDVLNTQGKAEDALINYQESLTIRRELVAHDSSNTGWHYDVSLALVRVGDALNAQGKPADALKNYQESLAILQKLVAHDPSNTGWQQGILALWEKIVDVLNKQDKPADALENYQKILVALQKLTAHDPSNAGWRNALATTYLAVAWYQLLNHQPERAIEASEQGLAIETDERMEATLHTNLAHGYLFTGQFDKARAIYVRYQDKITSDDRSFKQAVLDDFKEFRRHGIQHADMSRIEALLQ